MSESGTNVPPLLEPNKEAFSGGQYDDDSEFDKEFKLSLELWEQFWVRNC